MSEADPDAARPVRVALIDSGGANTGSVKFALDRLGANSVITVDPAVIEEADRVILPGVGAARHAMARLGDAGLVEFVRNLTVPLLGICLGMQLLYEFSDEGDTQCLGILRGRVERMQPAEHVRIPQMGWNKVDRLRRDTLTVALRNGAPAYFVHSYAAPVTEDTISTFTHGGTYTAIVGRGTVRGAQFHPERSGSFGQQLLRTFLEEKIS